MTTFTTTAHRGAGLEVRGADLRDDRDASAVRDLFHEHGLVFVRDQQLSTLDHLAFARHLGEVNVNRFFHAHPDHPEIALVVKEPDQRLNVGGFWHTDHSYDVEPALGSVLVARELPSRGGNTQFLSTYDAFEALPGRLQDRLRGLRAVHSAKQAFGSTATRIRRLIDPKATTENAGAADELAPVSHPVVIRHPLSGREALFINPSFTVRFEGWSVARSAPLLAAVYLHVLRAGLVADFRWEPGSVAIWDNRATWHNAKNDYAGERREMHRITLDGCRLTAARPETVARPARSTSATARSGSMAGGSPTP
jgi:taurine dioxygenase